MTAEPQQEERYSHLRLIPSQGQPEKLIEKICQTAVKVLAYLPIYTAVVVTLVLLAVIFGK